MPRSQIARTTVLALIFMLLVCTQSIASGTKKNAPYRQYVDHLQSKLLKVYFPPHGLWNFAGSEIEILIEKNGSAKLSKIVHPPLVRGKRNKTAELCLRSAVESVNPLEAPPKELKLPAKFLVKFTPQAKGNTIFSCVAKEL